MTGAAPCIYSVIILGLYGQMHGAQGRDVRATDACNVHRHRAQPLCDIALQISRAQVERDGGHMVSSQHIVLVMKEKQGKLRKSN